MTAKCIDREEYVGIPLTREGNRAGSFLSGTGRMSPLSSIRESFSNGCRRRAVIHVSAGTRCKIDRSVKKGGTAKYAPFVLLAKGAFLFFRKRRMKEDEYGAEGNSNADKI